MTGVQTCALPICFPVTIRWRTWGINSEGLVDVEGDFNCSGSGIKSLMGIRFGSVGGNFYCHNNQLTSLEGAPEKVGGNFYCCWNQLTSLGGAPREVGGDFDCHNNQLTSLKGAPREVRGNFDCSENQLTSLERAYRDWETDRKSTRLNSSHRSLSRMPSSA